MIFPRQFSQQSTEMAKRRLIFSLTWICHRSCLLFSFRLLLFPSKPEFSTAGASGLLDVPLRSSIRAVADFKAITCPPPQKFVKMVRPGFYHFTRYCFYTML